MTSLERNRLLAAAIVTAALIYFYPLLLPTPLLEPDEGLHATISQEMLEHHEWVLPTFQGEAFLDKPILYFWAQMVSLKTFGMNEFGVRLPGLLFGLLGAITTGLLAARLFDSRTGWFACLMSMTMFIPLSLAQAAVHDVALVPFTNLALMSLWELERATDRRRQLQWLSAAACMFALAFLTKALIGVAVIGVGYGLYLLLSRQLSIGSCVRVAAAVLLGAALASPWFIAMEFRVNGYLYYYFVERHVMGFATATQRHGTYPWWYYAPYISLGAIPWLWYIGPFLRDECKARMQGKRFTPQVIFVVCWFVGGLLFLSTAKSKLVTYSLPLFPALAILSAVSWDRFITRRLSETSSNWFLWMLRGAGSFGIIVPFGILLVCQQIIGNHWPPMAWLTATALSIFSGVIWQALARQRMNGSVELISMWVGGIVCLVMTWPLQMFAESHSERPLAKWLNEQNELPEHLVLIGEQPGSVIFYLTPELRQRLHSEQVTSVRIDELPQTNHLGSGAILAVTQQAIVQARTEHRRIPGSYTETVGQFQIFQDREDVSSAVQIAWKSTQ